MSYVLVFFFSGGGDTQYRRWNKAGVNDGLRICSMSYVLVFFFSGGGDTPSIGGGIRLGLTELKDEKKTHLKWGERRHSDDSDNDGSA